MGQHNYSPRHRRSSSGRTFNGKKESDRLYDGNMDWRNYRIKFLNINPRCYSCGESATTVDHLTPHLGDIKLFEQLDNHIPLCGSCHNKITGLFDRRYRRGNPVTNKIKWMQMKRLERGLTFKVKVLPAYR